MYENVRRRTFPIIRRLTQLGQLLIALRIAGGLTQRELAERLGVSESVVSRDGRMSITESPLSGPRESWTLCRRQYQPR